MSTGEGTIRQVLAGEARWCVVCGDNRQILPALPTGCADHVVTDPPYDERTHKNAATKSDVTRTSFGVEEFAAFGVEEFAAFGVEEFAAFGVESLRLARRWSLVFGTVEAMGVYATAVGDAWVRAGVWDKIAPSPQISGDRPGQAVEAIAIMHAKGRKRWNRGGGAGIWRFLAPKGEDRNGHPTPKPIDLMLALIADFTDRDELILDPFAGSGTTGAAALRLGRRVILIEREAQWADDCRERLLAEEHGTTTQAQRQGQQALFAKPAPCLDPDKMHGAADQFGGSDYT